MKNNQQLTQSRLKELLEYDKDTGIFVRIKKVCGSNGFTAQDKLDDHGYFRIKIDGFSYRLHRLAFLYTYGHIPNIIDHINRDRKDNRIINLRAATRRINCRNRTRNMNNVSGTKGIHYNQKINKWIVQISGDGKRYKGAYTSLDEAIEVRIKYENEIGYTCTK